MSHSPWLSPDQQHAWLGMRAVAALLEDALDRQLQRDSRLSHGHYVILAVLSGLPGHTVSMTTLANFTNSSQSRMSHAVARLEAQGWVRRGRDGASRRMVYATLTDRGLDVVRHAAPGHAAIVSQLVFSHLSAEQVEQLDQINSQILTALAEHGIPAVLPLSGREDTGPTA